MTEDEILSAKPYVAPEPEATIESLAGELVDAIMNQLCTFAVIRDAMEVLTPEQKQPMDDRLMHTAVATLSTSSLVTQVHADRPGIVPQETDTTFRFTGQPLEPEMTGEIFQVQVGGLLLSEQKR